MFTSTIKETEVVDPTHEVELPSPKESSGTKLDNRDEGHSLLQTLEVCDGAQHNIVDEGAGSSFDVDDEDGGDEEDEEREEDTDEDDDTVLESDADFDSDDENEATEKDDDMLEIMIDDIVDALDAAEMEEASLSEDQDLAFLCENVIHQDVMADLESSLDNIFISQKDESTDSLSNQSLVPEMNLDGQYDADKIQIQTNDPLPTQFGLHKNITSPLLCRHPEPYFGRDDDPAKLREICDDLMVMLGFHDPEAVKTKILSGPDHKIGNNLINMIKEDRYSHFLPEFPCLHTRKSRIVVALSA